ncbi:MAG TPA: hypothetical protein VGB82_23655 [Alphaproteobacteria bacterium]
MTIFTLSGPHPLSGFAIGNVVPWQTPGVFVLGRLTSRGALRPVQLVGRSDSDLAAALREHARRYEAQAFLFERARSALAAFEMECELFHRLRSPELRHPQRTHGTTWRCPVCEI